MDCYIFSLILIDFYKFLSTYLAFISDEFAWFYCFFVFFQHCNQCNIAIQILETEKVKNAFLVFSRIRVDGRLTENHELFWISCHLLPANNYFSKSDLHLIALLSGRQIHQKTQDSHFLDFFGFF